MLKVYVNASETLRQLRSDNKGVVSFEYVVVAFSIVTAVLATFAVAGPTGVTGALDTAIGKVTALLPH